MKYKPFINIKEQLKQFVVEGCVDTQIKIEKGEKK